MQKAKRFSQGRILHSCRNRAVAKDIAASHVSPTGMFPAAIAYCPFSATAKDESSDQGYVLGNRQGTPCFHRPSTWPLRTLFLHFLVGILGAERE